MHFEPRTIRLKDGRTAVLTPATPEYAAEMIEYLKITSAESPFLLRTPNEVTYTPESEIEILQRLLEDPRAFMMMALVDGVLAGNCGINPVGCKSRVMHRCSFAVAQKKAYWGLGIGTAMIGYASELASRMGYEQIELEVVDGNDRARTLYAKCGFAETGRRIRAMKYEDGLYRDEYIMTKML